MRPWPEISPRFAPQPWKTFSMPVHLKSPVAAALPRTYVRCTADKGPGEFNALTFARSWSRVQEGGWQLFELDGPHDAVSSEEGAALLLKLLAR
jgi:hypothetical protein